MMSDGFFGEMGIHLKYLVAGFAGGSVKAFRERKFKPWSLIGSVAVGGIAANYLTMVVSDFLGTPILLSAFIIGLIGMELCGQIIESATSWMPPIFKGKRNE